MDGTDKPTQDAEATGREIYALALRNAVAYKGRTQNKTVLGRLLGARPDLRNSIPEISRMVSQTVAEVNSMTLEQQREALAAMGDGAGGGPEGHESSPQSPSSPPQSPQQQAPHLPPLKNADGSEPATVTTRFPPEPNGYPHIGHAKAVIINSEYARMYGGRCILRIDDTNPEAERMEYHAAINVGLEWLGIKFDQVKSTSDDMELLYKKGDELMQAGMAYVCMCKKEKISSDRRERRACKCNRMDDVDEHYKRWSKMHKRKFKPGEAIMRFRGDMAADNAVMRDPVLFRVIDTRHYTKDTRYVVWPSYDMAVAIEDSADGVTHAFRSKEFEARAELIGAILDALGMRKPVQGFFSRLEFDGMPTSKRVIRPLMEDGKITGYDDPRIPTLGGLKRRGITPEAIRRFILSLGLTKANTVAPFETLESFNRSIIDGTSTRLFMVRDARRIVVSGLPSTLAHTITLPNHPMIEEMGRRSVATGGGTMYIPGSDAALIRRGTLVRLLGLALVFVTDADTRGEGDDTIRAEFVQSLDEPLTEDVRRRCHSRWMKGEPGAVDASDYATAVGGRPAEDRVLKMQWVSCDAAYGVRLVIPKKPFSGDTFDEESWEETEVYTEPYYAELKEGTAIQFVRFGYCRKDSQTRVIFTHH